MQFERLRRLRTRPCLGAMACLGILFVAGCSEVEVGEPARLSDLLVEGGKTALNPSFDPDTFRYSIVADDLTNEIRVTPFANLSVVIAINGRRTHSGVTESISTLAQGDTLRIEVKERHVGADAPVLYELLYLPADFPELRVTTLERGVSPDPLYVNLFGPSSSYLAILNNHGVPLFYRKDEQPAVDFKWHAATGERSYARLTGLRNRWGRRDAEIVLLDSDFTEIERVTTVGLSHTDSHDFLILPNDEFLLLSYDGSLRDLTGIGLSSQELVEDSVVQIINRMTRTVLFEWNSWGHVPFDEQTYPDIRGEYAHANSAFVDTDGNIIISARGTSQIIKISRPGGQVLWKLGGKSNQFMFINDPYSHLCGQHAAHRLANGNLLLFDNGQNCWPVVPARGELTRIVEYRIDEQLLEAELVWSYSQSGAYSTAQGSAQRLANGNTLIGWGRGPDVLVTEVNSSGEKVFEIVGLDDGEPVATYRAIRFPQ